MNSLRSQSAPVNSNVCIGVLVNYILNKAAAVNVDKNTIIYNNSFSFLKNAYIEIIVITAPNIVIPIGIPSPFSIVFYIKQRHVSLLHSFSSNQNF